jgi:phosphatidylserine decarboxylase
MFHKEGFKLIFIALTICFGGSIIANYFIDNQILKGGIIIALLIFLVLILQFFRNPKRNFKTSASQVFAPVDGKVVVIEEVFEKEYFKDKRLQVSVFMSPINVHVTRYPVGGEIVYSKYHPGKYLVAWHPKASEENERTSVVVASKIFGGVLHRQVAGALAKRIVNYAKEGETANQTADSGFIKFGSRVDVYLPLDAKIEVSLNQVVKGGISVLASK